jgi:ATP-dependent Clp protease ATP-binding subunit ClpX
MAKKKNTPIDSSTGGTDQPTNDEKKRTRKSRKQKTMDDLSIVDNKKDEYHTCSICGRKSNEVSTMICNADANVYVCSDCIENIYELAMSREAQLRGDLDPVRKFREEDSDDSDVMFNSNIPTPHQIKEYLDQYVIGQDDAKITLSVAVYNHYKRIMQKVDENDENAVTIEKNNIIICGNSGSGKTFLCKTIAKMLDVPVVSCTCTSITESGFVGDDAQVCLERLYAAANGDVKKAEMGICILDEFDKLGRPGGGPGLNRDVNGVGVQQALLRIIEGCDCYVDPIGGRRRPDEGQVLINSSNVLFIVCGRFELLPEIIKKRLNQNTLGFDLTDGKTEDGRIIDQQNIIRYAEADDFKKMGFIQEIIGRLPVITYVNPLTRDDLKRILLEPKNSIMKQYKKLFELSGKKLSIKDDVYDYIVEKGYHNDTGARGLRTIVESILKQKMFDAPSEKDETEVIIDMDYVKKVEARNFLDPTKKVEIDKKRKITL